MLYSCVLFYSLLNGIDPNLTQAVIAIESGGNPYALGKLGDSGLMQIRPKFVPETQHQLFNPCVNIARGTALLKKAKESCKHSIDKTWLICYNLGATGGRKIKHPKMQTYYRKVMSKL
jgi:soluble lytic murein transglycosylase-like protein